MFYNSEKLHCTSGKQTGVDYSVVGLDGIDLCGLGTIHGVMFLMGLVRVIYHYFFIRIHMCPPLNEWEF